MTYADPYGLRSEAECCDKLIASINIPQPVVDFAAGFGDAASFGATDRLRNALGWNEKVNHESFAYVAGGVGGEAAVVIATTGAGALDEAVGTESGTAGGPRAGKPFTRAGRREVIEANRQANEGVTRCANANCGIETVPAQRHTRGVRPPGNETHVDHKIRRRDGGDGSPSNGQVLCRDCNLDKGE